YFLEPSSVKCATLTSSLRISIMVGLIRGCRGEPLPGVWGFDHPMFSLLPYFAAFSKGVGITTNDQLLTTKPIPGELTILSTLSRTTVPVMTVEQLVYCLLEMRPAGVVQAQQAPLPLNLCLVLDRRGPLRGNKLA